MPQTFSTVEKQRMQQKLIQLAENVWLWPHGSIYNAVQSSVGILRAKNETILIDAGNSPRLAQRIQEELTERGFPPVSQIIYTHHHWDHTYGACEFQSTVIAHSLCKSILTEEAQKPWGRDYLRQQIKLNPRLKPSYQARERAIRDWDAFRIVVPNRVFERTLTLEFGQVFLELEHVGGQHAEDSIVVKVPQAQIMFLGDCYYPPPLHLRKPDSKPSMAMLAELESHEYTLYVEGHAKPLTRTRLLRMLERRA